MEKGETWEKVQLSEESLGLFSQLNAEIEKQGEVEKDLIFQGFSTYLGVTLCREALWSGMWEALRDSLVPPTATPNFFQVLRTLWSPLESSGVLQKLQAHVLIIFLPPDFHQV